MNEVLKERMDLVAGRVKEIVEEGVKNEAFDAYFKEMASFCRIIEEYMNFIEMDKMDRQMTSAWAKWNERLYADILPASYETSYANPAHATKVLGEEYGPMLSALYAELRSMIIPATEGRMEEVLIRMELFVEVYSAFVCKLEEEGICPSVEEIRDIIYWYVSDYSDISMEQRIKEMVCREDNYCVELLENADWSDETNLYRYGEYISENEKQMARFMQTLPEETIATMADTFTEGYRIGFVLGGKDLGKKKSAELRYMVGFERMMVRAAANLRKMGLTPIIRRTPMGLLQDGGLMKLGAIGGNPCKQYDYDHKDDKALYWDKQIVQRKLELTRTIFEKYKEDAYLFAGPAVQEAFGEKTFEPVNKKESYSLSDKQQKLVVEYRSEAGRIQRDYIIEEERSFTIIAFPVPEIGDDFEAIFEETIKINTLDYMKYRNIQQTIIDTLDTGVAVVIKGLGDNTTDLRVALKRLNDPAKETIFENCVADVNIPVGEVFTSPRLTGTNGVLNVSKVYLNELEYRNLTVTFTDGMITAYDCANFETEAENKKFIKENLLFHRETLPLGEFAIGTNTTAYVMARKFGIESKLPILIAEKTGPHFAVGDTCYSHAEDTPVFNPDGKEIVARDNEIVEKRHENPAESYFDCHTDITIPYDELGELSVIRENGEVIPIILEGRFVLAGCEDLNKPFDGEEF